ncbi:MAG: lamin tail domain-containing protein [Planctomycetota bacterium]|nr:lamin tail domain-containing protein [Planctomycetota bacterium]
MRTRLLPLLALCAAAPLASAGDLEVHFIDVGQGAAALVIGPDGTTVLVDGGDPGDGTAEVVPYLQSLGLTGLDYSFMSHWHTDHYGGLDEVFNGGFLPSGAAYDRGNVDMPSGTQVTQYLLAVGSKRQVATLGLILALGDGATLEVVSANGATPLGNLDPSSYSQAENGRSIAVVVRYKDFDVYLGGDLTGGGNGTADVETWAANYIGQVEVAMASHHGSNTSSQSSAVTVLDPSLVIYSCGLDNSYFHPSKTVVNRWNQTSAARVAWGTTEGDTDNGSGGWTPAEGSIVVSSDGFRFVAKPAGAPAVQAVEFATFEHPANSPGPGTLAISEVLVDPVASSDTYGEWFELVNVSTQLIDLGGVELKAGSDSFDLVSRVLLDYGERLVIGVDGRRSRNGDVWVPIGAPFGDFSLNNGGESLELRNPGGSLVDSVQWGPGGFSVQSGVSAERIDPFAPGVASNFQPATASFGSGDKGTPTNQNTGETGTWPAGLVVPSVHHDGSLELRMKAPEDPLKFYFVGLSQGFLPGLDILGLHVPLNPDGLFLSFLNVPGTFGSLNLVGEAAFELPLGDNPSLIGATAFASYVTFGVGPGGLVGSDVSNLVLVTVQ